MGKLALITLAQYSSDEKVSNAVLRAQVREVIEASVLSKSWTIDAITIVDETGMMLTESPQSA